MIEGVGDTPVPRERESTMRRTAAVLGHDKLHKGMNWASIAGLAATAVLGYLADARNGQKQERIATGAATEIAVLQAFKEDAEADLKTQQEQIVQLRLAVAKLQAANEVLASVGAAGPARARAREAIEDVQELLDASPAPRVRAEAPEQATRAEGIKRKLLLAE